MNAPSPRAVAVEALLRWEQGREHAHDVLHAALEAERLSPLDRALLTEFFYGVLRNLSLLDFLIDRLRPEPVDPRTRQALRLGLYQLRRMRVPEHAAVNETVDVAGRARSLVNALLRRSIRERAELDRLVLAAPEEIRWSHPALLLERWRRAFGAEDATRLVRWNNTPAEVFIRVNTLKVTPGELRRSAPDAEQVPGHPLALRVRRLPPSWLVEGLCYAQDPSTLAACDLLGPEPGESVLDACAAPGGKATYLGQLMRNEGRLVACDAAPARMPRLEGNLARLGVSIAQTVCCDWLRRQCEFAPSSFDRILVDAPCTNTGVLRRRVDARWRLTEEDFARMPERQMAIVSATVPLLRPGGVLVYSTCSVEREENEGVIQQIRQRHPELRLAETRQTLPFRDGVDGAFAARFDRQ